MSTPRHIPKGKVVLTYEDYVLLPNDRNRYEILEGELTVTPAPGTKHQRVSANLFKLLSTHIDERNLGKLFYAPIDLILDPTTILQPDLLFVFSARQHIITERAVEGIPDLVIEIISPTTKRTDRVTKAQIYAPTVKLLGRSLMAKSEIRISKMRNKRAYSRWHMAYS